MANPGKEIFVQLFRASCEKCFSQPLRDALTEPEAKRLADDIQQRTGLIIGWKSLKNFSVFVTNSSMRRDENPSLATLDTLARYVLDAPPADEAMRKTAGDTYAYWYRYERESRAESRGPMKMGAGWRMIGWAFLTILLVVAGVLIFNAFRDSHTRVAEYFSNVSDDSLALRGWTIRRRDAVHWEQRNTRPGHLTLYTLPGDNWPEAGSDAHMKNILVRSIDEKCFTAEVHLTDFIPKRNWQQAGLMISEDSLFNGKALRLSVGYNDFFGGFQNPPEIIIQVVGSSTRNDATRPEEIAHTPIFTGDPTTDSLIRSNMSACALKIEKREGKFRILYAIGRMKEFAFKEAVSREIDFEPRYLGVFASQGLADVEDVIPVQVDFFGYSGHDCDNSF